MNHIMIDCYGASETRLNDINEVNDLLSQIGMELKLPDVMPPFLLPYYYANEQLDVGISAFVLFDGGHMTVHTFPKRGCMFVDLLADGYFDAEKLKDSLNRHFHYSREQVIRTERRYLDTSIDEERIYSDSGNSGKDFGPHAIGRMENVDITFEQIYDLLDKMPEQINMQMICRPYVIKSSVSKPKYISGIVLIAQSHIAFHYDLELKTLYCDMFSCSFYKSEGFVKYLENLFGPFENMTIVRGSKHTDNVQRYESKVARLSKWKKNSR